MAERPIWLIGCGNMAGAMLTGWLAAGHDPSMFRVIDPATPILPEGVQLFDGPPAGGFGPSVVQLGFKPHMLADVAPGLASSVTSETIVTSIMAGVEIASLRAAFPDAEAIVRIMPNMAVAMGKGAIGFVPEQNYSPTEIENFLAPLGQVEQIINEAQLNAVTVLSGSGPAFFYRFVDALAEAGGAIGLDPAQALRMALATAEGAAALAVSSNESPGELAERVASPGGTTRAGLDILDQDAALKQLVEETLSAAMRRAEEMARETRER